MIGILRVVAFGHFFWTPGYDFTNTWGPSYSAIETSLAIIAACIPFMRRALGYWFPRLFASTVRRTGDAEGGPYHQQHDIPEGRSDLSQAIELHGVVPNRARVQFGSCLESSQDKILPKTSDTRKTTIVGYVLLRILQITRLTDSR